MLVFNPPQIVYRNSNPATDLAIDGIKAEVLGFAEPSLNGNCMLQSKTMTGALPPIGINSPQWTCVQNGQVFSATLPNGPTNTISWRIFLPPNTINGVWRSATSVKGFQLRSLFSILKGGEQLKGYPQNCDWTLVIRPLPTAVAFQNHIQYHEFQHVADHRWLAEQIIGPWDAWHNEVVQKHLTFTRNNRVELLSALKLTSYCESPIRIARYWQKSLYECGDLFHSTPNGSLPIMKIERLVGTPRIDGGKMELHLTIEANTLIPAQIIPNSPPHCNFKLKDMNKVINGLEAKLTCGGGLPVIRSLMGFHNVNNRFPNTVIQLPDVDDEDFYLGF